MFENLKLKKGKNDYESVKNAKEIINAILDESVIFDGHDLWFVAAIIRKLAHQSIRDAYALYCITTNYEWEEGFGYGNFCLPPTKYAIELMTIKENKKAFRKALKGGSIDFLVDVWNEHNVEDIQVFKH